MMHMASSQRSRGDEAEDGWVDAMGCIRLFYPNFCRFHCIRLQGQFSLLVGPINRTQGVVCSLPLLLTFICISYIRISVPRTEFCFQ
jgi:hypothetical protein